MNGYDNKKDDYQYIIEKVGKRLFQERFQELLQSANKFIEQAGYAGNVECNERILLVSDE